MYFPRGSRALLRQSQPAKSEREKKAQTAKPEPNFVLAVQQPYTGGLGPRRVLLPTESKALDARVYENRTTRLGQAARGLEAPSTYSFEVAFESKLVTRPSGNPDPTPFTSSRDSKFWSRVCSEDWSPDSEFRISGLRGLCFQGSAFTACSGIMRPELPTQPFEVQRGSTRRTSITPRELAAALSF